ncbi:NAD(P)-dependent dehydrogenase (short-subunit alcohol dehydrogenase family) [Rhodoligotrophos appendicifer]|uniref:SDR family NAD(P)-dependent oxidoreductase n=1 Tax=Rhodoligotrophos appendicifer TaxID=987056 RepID=UPI00118607C1|nr:SDR family NAD(P)-dependent oxidoreductase [Rhodoligotrophos appendicifer]
MNRFKDKIVVVVGAGSIGPGWGNGKAAAVLYAREGARVFAADVNLEAARETQEIIRGEGGACEVGTVDVTSEDSILALFDQVFAATDRIDVLHNNVGLTRPGATVDVSAKDWDDIFAINLRSMFLTCRTVLPAMIEAGSGAIVNISSISSMRWLGSPMASYEASKAGVTQFTRAIALEHASRGIRANVVTPGLMDTPTIVAPYSAIAGAAQMDEVRRRRAEAVPMGRMGDAWDIAHAALFLASDHARYITGQELIVDGGITRMVGFKPR